MKIPKCYKRKIIINKLRINQQSDYIVYIAVNIESVFFLNKKSDVK